MSHPSSWDGMTRRGTVPAGRYRFEVRALNYPQGRINRSPYFTVSHRYRVLQEVKTPRQRAVQSLIRKSKLRNGRITRGPLGSLNYLSNSPARPTPDLRTLHRIKLPPNRVGKAEIWFSGSWPQWAQHPRVFLIAPSGRRVPASGWDYPDRQNMRFTVPRRFVRADGLVRFELAVKHAGRTRIRDFRVGYLRYRWVS
ncbi:hypothetical protein [Nocardioides speluncae]|uniref:hypothetical protein n=1 Tax=Nocardioides speluncae TaxID=2670337 RepID=UPI0012B181AA|nr:hypothetical protein [Nocardioides speluncae]